MLFKLGEHELLDHLQSSATKINDVDQLSISSGRISFFSDDIED